MGTNSRFVVLVVALVFSYSVGCDTADSEPDEAIVLQGLVSDAETEEPIAEAQIRLFLRDDPRGFLWMDSTTTDASGRYRLEYSVPDVCDEYNVRFELSASVSSPDRFAEASYYDDGCVPTQKTVNFTLH